MMQVQKDFSDLLGLLNENGVEYLIVGGYALAWHGAPRFTGDIDVLIRPAPDNVERMLRSLAQFGFGASGLTAAVFLAANMILQLGRPPVQAHVMSGITGVTWEDAWESRVGGRYGAVSVQFIGRDAFIANKRAAGRLKDLADIEALGKIDKRRRGSQ